VTRRGVLEDSSRPVELWVHSEPLSESMVSRSRPK
jgi:hypothetical protein